MTVPLFYFCLVHEEKQDSSTYSFKFIDDRPNAIHQRKFQGLSNNRSEVSQFKTYQQMADNSSQQQPIQKKASPEPGRRASPEPGRRENQGGLPEKLKSGVENLSGVSMDDVRVHYNSSKPAQLHAHAYSQGTNIHLASGQEKHLPHEAWHVVQQKQGRVQPTMQMKGNVAINDNSVLEKEADVMGAKANSNSQVEVSQFKGGTLIDVYNHSNENDTVQRQEIVQRIIVVAESQLDYNQFVGIYQMLVNGIDNRVTLLSILGKSNIEDEQIGLRGHGNGPGGRYANMDAGVLAQTLIDAGVNESNKVIDLLSCKSGKGGGMSYAEEFATAMGHKSTV